MTQSYPEILLVLICALASLSAAERPNILFIMSDDHSCQAMSAYASRLAPLDPTPNLDRLAKQGMVFDRVFCSNSICTPSRASVMTGEYSNVKGSATYTPSFPETAASCTNR